MSNSRKSRNVRKTFVRRLKSKKQKLLRAKVAHGWKYPKGTLERRKGDVYWFEGQFRNYKNTLTRRQQRLLKQVLNMCEIIKYIKKALAWTKNEINNINESLVILERDPDLQKIMDHMKDIQTRRQKDLEERLLHMWAEYKYIKKQMAFNRAQINRLITGLGMIEVEKEITEHKIMEKEMNDVCAVEITTTTIIARKK